MSEATPDFIAVDWGTSRLRAWALGADGAVQRSVTRDTGMGTLDRAGFEPALLAAIGPWLQARTSVIACGMVGARQGWHEVPYVPVPAKPAELRPVAVAASDPRLDVAIVPGLSQAQAPDVMRGEETQIAGYLLENPDFDGVLCLPGTHTKWVHISAGEVVSFQTFMTGELFALTATQSVLRHVVGAEALDDEAFVQAVSDGLSRPERLAAALFSIRAAGMLDDMPPEIARARLSGLLIGAELAAARPYWLGQDIVVIGAPALSKLYQSALAAQGAQPRLTDATAATLRGLAQYRRLHTKAPA